MIAVKYAGVLPTLASASFRYVRFAGVVRVGAQISAPTVPTASSPRLRMTCSSVMTPLPISGSFPFNPYSAYCLMKRTPCAATNTAHTASAFRLICVRYGAKSRTLSGTQIFWTTRPPWSSNTRWKPPICSWPNGLSIATVTTLLYLSTRAA